VLVSGDEEYRSEEALPQLAKILSKRHGFKCTVLFAIGKDGTIDPKRNDNIPGLEALKTADLMVLFTRFRMSSRRSCWVAVSNAFRGKSRVERHRLVNAALAAELAGGVHALAIHAAAPDEGL